MVLWIVNFIAVFCKKCLMTKDVWLDLVSELNAETGICFL